MSSLCHSVVGFGSDSLVVDIECHLSNNLPTIVITGFANRIVSESKDRLRGAFMSTGVRLPRKRITINLAPADIPKTDTSLDVAIAMSIWAADGHIQPLPRTQAAIGELGLNGSVRPVRGIIGKLLAGRAHGITEFYIPVTNLAQAQLVPHIKLLPIANLSQLHEHLIQQALITTINTGTGDYTPVHSDPATGIGLDDIAGQALAKRALVIAAAGGHNVLLTGPPGTGKSMLARTLPSLLPALTHEESLEVTHLQSLARNNFEQLFVHRPFRSPHHSTSLTAMLGGANLQPGEVSLSHRGVLCLDEFPEFSRQTLEALRQPLEERVIHVARSRHTTQYPADFILIATANPCPCGYYGSNLRSCVCVASQRQRYQAKLSGPVIDRIDLCCNVHDIDYKRLLTTGDNHPSEASDVAAARTRQKQRYNSSTVLNSSVSDRLLKQHARLNAGAQSTLTIAAQSMGLSARGYIRVVKVARTIADLANSPAITSSHVAEALQYRSRPPAETAPV